MALVKREKSYSWNVTSSKNTRYKLPKIKDVPTIDYEKLASLCDIDGLKNNENPETSPEAHERFMNNYKQMFAPRPKLLGFPIHSEKRDEMKDSTKSLSQKSTGPTHDADTQHADKDRSDKHKSHNISDYLPLYHRTRKSEDPLTIRTNNMKTLRRLLRKFPFERTAVDNDRICSILKTFPFFAQCIPANVLKELCVVAKLESWNIVDFTVFGNNGLYMILRGAVCPLSYPYLNFTNVDNIEMMSSPTSTMRSSTPEPTESEENLEVGECFGTLKKIEGREPTSKLFSVRTVEPSCEFLKISASDYKRVIEQIVQREHTEKLNLVLSGSQYAMWPRQPLVQVANLIEWIDYPPNTVVASEGYKAPFIAFIKSGECHVLRQVEVMQTLRNGKREHKTKQVVMGKLKPSNSFAEISVLFDEPISISIVTATDIQLGVIKPEKIQELDDVTIQLFKQSNSKTWGKLTKEEIEEEYMQQELKREWNEFKHNIVIDSINQHGIRPGYGKWAK